MSTHWDGLDGFTARCRIISRTAEEEDERFALSCSYAKQSSFEEEDKDDANDEDDDDDSRTELGIAIERIGWIGFRSHTEADEYYPGLIAHILFQFLSITISQRRQLEDANPATLCLNAPLLPSGWDAWLVGCLSVCLSCWPNPILIHPR